MEGRRAETYHCSVADLERLDSIEEPLRLRTAEKQTLTCQVRAIDVPGEIGGCEGGAEVREEACGADDEGFSGHFFELKDFFDDSLDKNNQQCSSIQGAR